MPLSLEEFKMQETENDDHDKGYVPESLDGGDLGTQRKLYCRELVARFGQWRSIPQIHKSSIVRPPANWQSCIEESQESMDSHVLFVGIEN